MKLTFIAHHFPVHTETFVSEPLGWLRNAGVDVAMVAARPGDAGAHAPAGIDPRILSPMPGHAVATTLLGAPLQTLAAVARTLQLPNTRVTVKKYVWLAMLPEVRSADAVVVHFGSAGVKWLVPLALARKPTAVYFHGYDVGMTIAAQPGVYDDLFRSGVGLLTNSAFQRDRLVAAGAPATNVRVVPLGVSPEFSTGHAERPSHPLRIVTIGRLVPKKGIDVSVRAFARLRQHAGQDWEYHIVGDGPLLDDVRALTASLNLNGAVHFRGVLPRGETRTLLGSASMFVLASRTSGDGDTEGTPVSILEAASLGIPVVATRHAGIPEILPREASDEGFLVEENDVDALAAALARLAASSELRARWGNACRAHVRTRHSAAAFVSSLIDAVQTAAGVPSLRGRRA